MKVRDLEKATLKDVTYYILISWTSEEFVSGETYKNAFKTEKAARRRAKMMMSTGKYKAIQLRKEEVWLRDESHEYSSSSPIERYTA